MAAGAAQRLLQGALLLACLGLRPRAVQGTVGAAIQGDGVIRPPLKPHPQGL